MPGRPVSTPPLFKRDLLGLSLVNRNTSRVKSVLSRFARQIVLKSPRRWVSPRLWALVIGLFIAAQVGFALHQSQHHLRPDIVTTTDDCTLCQITAGIGTGPEAPLLVLPVFILLAIVSLPPVRAMRPARFTPSFRSRAPPSSPRI